jgi:hypothetical protein
MPESEKHAALVELFRRHPGLAARLVQQSGRARLPERYTARSADPVFRTKHAADALSLIHDADDVVVLAIPVEIQLRIDKEKDFTLPLYAWAARALQHCASRALIVVMSRKVATWARRLVHDWPDQRVQFIVLGPDDIPRVTDLAEARADPAFAVLSAAIHGEAPDGAPVMRAAAAALMVLPRAQFHKYSSLVFHHLSEPAVDAIIEDIMQTQGHEKQEYAAGWKAYLRKIEARGEARGEAKGEARAEYKVRAELLLKFLAQREIQVDGSARAQIEACKDIDQLDRWLARVLTATNTADLFTP